MNHEKDCRYFGSAQPCAREDCKKLNEMRYAGSNLGLQAVEENPYFLARELAISAVSNEIARLKRGRDRQAAGAPSNYEGNPISNAGFSWVTKGYQITTVIKELEIIIKNINASNY